MSSDTSSIKVLFKKILLRWYDPEARPMPWKGETDQYKIWISEVILQQTRVEQGWEYYMRFIDKYPDVSDLAHAPQDDVLKLWQGLGYYSRARNLHKGAKQIVEKHNGQIPADLKLILDISSIGPYTAAAIASFAFGLPHAVLDGNVIRIISRIFGIWEAFDTTPGLKLFRELAQGLMDMDQPAIYNQAIMDFGATVCTPALPKCPGCPFQVHCFALNTGKINELPVKSKKIKKRDRFFNYLVLEHSGKIFVQERKEKDVYSGMYEFILQESEGQLTPGDEELMIEKVTGAKQKFQKTELKKAHILTHQRLHVNFYFVKLEDKPEIPFGNWLEKESLKSLPVPKFIHDYLPHIPEK